MANVPVMPGGWVPIVSIQSAMAGVVEARVLVRLPALVSKDGLVVNANYLVVVQIPAPSLGAMAAIIRANGGAVIVIGSREGVLLEQSIPTLVRALRLQVTTMDAAQSGPITSQIGRPVSAISPNVLKTVTMAHAWLQTCVFAMMDIAAQVVALLSVRPRALSKAHVLVPTLAAVELDSWDQHASRLHAKQAVSTVHARFRSGATATLIGLENCAIKLFLERDVSTELRVILVTAIVIPTTLAICALRRRLSQLTSTAMSFLTSTTRIIFPMTLTMLLLSWI